MITIHDALKRFKFDWQRDLTRMWPHATKLRKFWYTKWDPGTRAIFYLRLQFLCWDAGLQVISRIVATRNHRLHGIDIVPGARIGPGVIIRHPTGIVIGKAAKLGANATIMHGVTLGQRRIEEYPVHNPLVGDDVTLGANAVLLGNIQVGSGATIGAGSIVLGDVEAEAVVVGTHRGITTK